VATSQLQSLYTSLPPTLQEYLKSASQIVHQKLPHQLQKYSGTHIGKASSLIANTDPTTLAITWILPLIALLFFMSRDFWPSGGRYSPFAHAGGPPPRVTEDDYDYIIDDGGAPSRSQNDNYGFPSRGHASRHVSRVDIADLDPDILIMKHKGTTYPLHFPAFDIAEGHLKVGELRRVAAKETKTDDPRRVKLLYKGKSLRDDHRACKDEHLKQNSEILCVISAPDPYSRDRDRDRDDGNESSSSASSEMIANGLDKGPRVDVDGTIIGGPEPRKRKGHRGGRKKRRDGGGSDRTSPRDSGFLGVTSNGTSSTPREPSPNRRVPSPAPPPPKKPSTPTEALDQISDAFHFNFLPQVKAFLDRPPAEKKARDFEYKKLSETILAQVLIKLDSVTTEGNEGLRARRKELVKETQSWLNELDKVGKR
jgi:hypothetical protein